MFYMSMKSQGYQCKMGYIWYERLFSFSQINVTLRYLWGTVLLFSVERRCGENSCSVTRGTTQRSWTQTLWGKKMSSYQRISFKILHFKKIFGVNFHFILEMSLWALANRTLKSVWNELVCLCWLNIKAFKKWGKKRRYIVI